MKILFLAAEVVPFAKTGGLADVAGALPKALRQLGHDIRLCMPRYGRIELARFNLTKILDAFPAPADDAQELVSVFEGVLGADIPVYFVDHDRYFNREGLYGYPDDGERFVLWCRATLEMLKRLDWAPDIIHCNDWHAGIVPNWLATLYKKDPFFQDTATVYTIHNLQYQGIFGHRVLEIAGLDEYGFIHHHQTPALNEVVDLMSRGIIFADVISTVSPTYAQEILTPEHGEQLDPLLRERQDRLFGILNGVDYEEMNPATDKYIAATYDLSTLDRRIDNKLALQREANLPVDPQVPVLGMVSRLVDQKGLDLVVEVLERALPVIPFQFVLLGTGDQHYHNLLLRYGKDFPRQVAVFLTFNAPLAQKIYAGADMFLMPSRFEPCGLGQLISLRYGCIPVVRRTGGLADTVQDFDPRTGEGNGFVFERYHRWDFLATLVRATENYKHQDTWRRLQERGLRADYSWAASARQYVGLYQKAAAFRRGAGG